MRDNANSVKIIGYLYDISKMSLRTSGPDSKHPGTEYIKGEMNIALFPASSVLPRFQPIPMRDATSVAVSSRFGVLQCSLSWLMASIAS